MSNIIINLKAVRELLSQSKHWTQNWYAKDAKGFACAPSDNDAICWCLVGALERIVGDGDHANPLLRWLRMELPAGEMSVSKWNDKRGRTHAEVLDLLDRVIATAEAAGSNE